MSNKNYKSNDKNLKQKITRKDAIKRAGKYAVLTAATMLVLSPRSSQAQSEVPPTPGWD